jgi:hypothetical protein
VTETSILKAELGNYANCLKPVRFLATPRFLNLKDLETYMSRKLQHLLVPDAHPTTFLFDCEKLLATVADLPDYVEHWQNMPLGAKTRRPRFPSSNLTESTNN